MPKRKLHVQQLKVGLPKLVIIIIIKTAILQILTNNYSDSSINNIHVHLPLTCYYRKEDLLKIYHYQAMENYNKQKRISDKF